jgi:hypothetical protein
MTKKPKEPRWVIAFLRALERSGVARAAAADAGIDYTTAYARRRAHAGFAAEWAAALGRHSAAAQGDAEDVAAARRADRADAVVQPPTALVPLPSPASPGPEHPRPALQLASPAGLAGSEELVISGGQVKRAGHGRWSERKEEIFFEELAATANARRAAQAVGMTKNAVLQRRARHPYFAAKWDAVVKAARANINLYLVEASNKTFDPDELDVGEGPPKVTIDQAIKIAQMAGREAAEDSLASVQRHEQSVEAVRARIEKMLDAMRCAEIRARTAAGWTYDESFDALIPPGYVAGPDYRPGEEAPRWDWRIEEA